MTDEQHEQAVLIKDELETLLESLVNTYFSKGVADPEVEDLVRRLLSEQMRFWK